ncbi:MAG TPA: TonB family protein [Pyrinomonadaceae bacterium]|nr:TonB family protein [Pyrinomonadaceae bacterium]
MKICPSCQRTYADDAMSFCLDDGTPLTSAPAASSEPGATMRIPAARLTHQAPTEVLPGEEINAAPVRSTRGGSREAVPTPPARKGSALPWILGAALILGLSGIVIALILTRNNGPENSQTAQTVNQSNSAPSPSNSSTGQPGQGEVPALGTTTEPAGGAPGAAQTGRTPEQVSTTPKPTPSPKQTPSPGVKDEPPPTPAETPAPKPKGPISGGVLNGKAISKPAPPYPPVARAARASGTVIVQVSVDETGKVTSARAVSGHPLLQQAAVQAAYQARFSPTLLSGQPVKVTGVLTYNFVIQ